MALPTAATPSPVSADPAIVDMIYDIATEYGVSGNLMYRIVRCETGGTFNSWSVGRAGEYGLGQWHPRGVWWDTSLGRQGHPRPLGNPDPDLRMMGEVIANGGAYQHWYYCSRRG
jgi:hypothetical protein